MRFLRPFRILLILAVSVLFAACSGGTDSSSSSVGRLTLNITDAAVDNAEHVYIQFRGIELNGPNGRNTYYYCQGTTAEDTVISTTPCTTYKPLQLDLLALSAGVSDTLLDVSLPAGHYSWARLIVDTDGPLDSYIVLDGGAEHELVIPSSDQSGLKLNRGFNVPAGGHANFTIDFDLRKSVHLPMSGTDYLLRPTLRIVDNVQIGHIAGTVDSTLVTSNDCAVYVFTGAGVTPDDIDGTNPEPVTTATVTYNASTSQYVYKAAFLEVGGYTLALTCDAALDDPATDDTLSFTYVANETVTTGNTTVHNIAP